MKSLTFKFQENILHLLEKSTIFLNNSGNSLSTTCFRDAAKTEEYVPKCNNQEEEQGM